MTTEVLCRHEYVTIYQRRLKGLDRRLVATRAYLPVGFKMADFGHLSEGSYCFCSKCRARLFPKRSQAEKQVARELLAKSKAQKELDAMAAERMDEETFLDGEGQSDVDAENAKVSAAEIHVEELELEPLGMEDIQSDRVNIGDDEESSCLADEG